MSFIASGTGLTAALTSALGSIGITGTMGSIAAGALANGLVGAGLGAGTSALMGGDPGDGALVGGVGGAVSGGLGGAAASPGGSAGAAVTKALDATSQIGQAAEKAGTSLAQIGAQSSPAMSPGLLGQLAQSPMSQGLANAGTSVGQIAQSAAPVMPGAIAQAQLGTQGLLSPEMLAKYGPKVGQAGMALMNQKPQQQPIVLPTPAPMPSRLPYRPMPMVPVGRV